MHEDQIELRLKAKACRLLADTAVDVMREALWLDRADYWDNLAKQAEKRLRAPLEPPPTHDATQSQSTFAPGTSMQTIDAHLPERFPSATACVKVVLTFAAVGLIGFALLPLIGY